MAGRIDARLKELGITVPEPRAPQANYIPFVVTGNLVFVSGQVSQASDGLIAGKVGGDLDIATGQKAARACALNLLGQLKVACGGDLDRVKRVVKLGGFVNAPPDFIGPPQVMNGASDLMVDVFGEAGRHARFAVATASLPQGAAVEVDGVFEIG
jgi:enamine deaminase RidA (YjgF/YER057c/UK114 family)